MRNLTRMRARWFIGLIVSVAFCFPGAAQAGESVFASGPNKVHLLELFTSEGCSSCPPAEEWLTKLKQNPGLWRDFVPVAFHVDYWDHLGWRDRFASKEWTARQQTYATRWNAESIYTPGFVIDGRELRAPEVPHGSQEIIGQIRLKISGNDAMVTFDPAKKDGRGYEVYLATLGFALASDVAAGENHGRKLTHDFVVLSVQKAPLSAGATEVTLSIDKSRAEKKGALAAWITYAGDPAPIQAIGGWLQ
jgi:hypothetical protein